MAAEVAYVPTSAISPCPLSQNCESVEILSLLRLARAQLAQASCARGHTMTGLALACVPETFMFPSGFINQIWCGSFTDCPKSFSVLL